jgi:hypothetical protein
MDDRASLEMHRLQLGGLNAKLQLSLVVLSDGGSKSVEDTTMGGEEVMANSGKRLASAAVGEGS